MFWNLTNKKNTDIFSHLLKINVKLNFMFCVLYSFKGTDPQISKTIKVLPELQDYGHFCLDTKAGFEDQKQPVGGCKICVLINFVKFTIKHLRRSHFLIRCRATSGRLLLKILHLWQDSPWTQDVNWTYKRCSEDVQDVFWTSYVRLIYVLYLWGWPCYITNNFQGM